MIEGDDDDPVAGDTDYAEFCLFPREVDSFRLLMILGAFVNTVATKSKGTA